MKKDAMRRRSRMRIKNFDTCSDPRLPTPAKSPHDMGFEDFLSGTFIQVATIFEDALIFVLACTAVEMGVLVGALVWWFCFASKWRAKTERYKVIPLKDGRPGPIPGTEAASASALGANLEAVLPEHGLPPHDCPEGLPASDVHVDMDDNVPAHELELFAVQVETIFD